MNVRRWSRAVPFVLLGAAAGVLGAATSPTVQYASANGDELSVMQERKPGGHTITYVGGGDSMTGGEDECKQGPDFACIDIGGGGNSFRLMVPRDLQRRIAATVSAMKATRNRQSLEQLRWSDGEFDYRVEPRHRIPNNYPIVWEPVRFFGTEIDAVLVVVYRSGQADSRQPVTNFLYNAEHGVLALDYRYGNERGGIKFVSYWLEGTCGLVPIRPCVEKRTKMKRGPAFP